MLHGGGVPRPEVTALRIVPHFQKLEDGHSVYGRGQRECHNSTLSHLRNFHVPCTVSNVQMGAENKIPRLNRRWRMMNLFVTRWTFDGIPSDIRVALRTAFHIDPATPGESAIPLGIQMEFYRFIENPVSEITNSSKQ